MGVKWSLECRLRRSMTDQKPTLPGIFDVRLPRELVVRQWRKFTRVSFPDELVTSYVNRLVEGLESVNLPEVNASGIYFALKENTAEFCTRNKENKLAIYDIEFYVANSLSTVDHPEASFFVETMNLIGNLHKATMNVSKVRRR